MSAFNRTNIVGWGVLIGFALLPGFSRERGAHGAAVYIRAKYH